MKLHHCFALGLPMMGNWAMAADMSVKFEIPQLNVAEYHRPYVAMWLEKADQTVVTNLAVLYDLKKRDNGGTKWLKDLRQWWRKSGRDLQMPVDGVSGATRTTGEQSISFGGNKLALDKLAAGEYHFVIEAAREAGGREMLRIPLQLPLKKSQSFTARGKEELGAVTVQINQ